MYGSLQTKQLIDAMTHEDFMRLFLQNERELLRYVMVFVPNSHDARDIVQNTAVALWKKIDHYDPSQPFGPWAFRFARIEAKVFLRREARWHRFLEDDVIEMLELRRNEISKDLDERRIHLRDCLRKLPEKQRGIIEGYYFKDHTVDELATLGGRTVEAIYKSLQRIRGSLMTCVNQRLETAS